MKSLLRTHNVLLIHDFDSSHVLQGLHDLIASGQVHDVLSHNKLDEKIVAEGWGGVTLFQIQNRLYKGVGKIGAGAKASFRWFCQCRRAAPHTKFAKVLH